MILGIEASHAMKPKRTGVEEYCFQIIQHLKEVVPADVRVILYTSGVKGEKLKVKSESEELFDNLPANWEVKVLGWPFRKLWTQVRLSWEFLWRPPDVFFAPGQLIPLVCPRRTIVTIHDSAFLVYPSAYNFLGRQYLRLMNWWIIKKADRIVTPSAFNARELRRLYGDRAANKAEVIAHGYNSDRFTEQSEVAVQKMLSDYGITRPYILSIGRLEEKKNTKRIVEAHRMLCERRRGQSLPELVFVGSSGVGYGDVQEAIRRSPFRQHIRELGYVSSEVAPLLLSGAAAFIFPSLYEGFGLPVVEAMASGCPVVTARGTSLDEVVGEAALLVDPTDMSEIASTLEKVLYDGVTSVSLKQKGLLRSRSFSWEKAARETWDVIVKT